MQVPTSIHRAKDFFFIKILLFTKVTLRLILVVLLAPYLKVKDHIQPLPGHRSFA